MTFLIGLCVVRRCLLCVLSGALSPPVSLSLSLRPSGCAANHLSSLSGSASEYKTRPQQHVIHAGWLDREPAPIETFPANYSSSCTESQRPRTHRCTRTAPTRSRRWENPPVFNDCPFGSAAPRAHVKQASYRSSDWLEWLGRCAWEEPGRRFSILCDRCLRNPSPLIAAHVSPKAAHIPSSMPEIPLLSPRRSMVIVPCLWAIYGGLISPRHRSDICVHTDAATAELWTYELYGADDLNMKHTHMLN